MRLSLKIAMRDAGNSWWIAKKFARPWTWPWPDFVDFRHDSANSIHIYVPAERVRERTVQIVDAETGPVLVPAASLSAVRQADQQQARHRQAHQAPHRCQALHHLHLQLDSITIVSEV